MKNLLLILALFVGNSFAEEDYPIELTCEIGRNIIFSLICYLPAFFGLRILWKAMKNSS